MAAVEALLRIYFGYCNLAAERGDAATLFRSISCPWSLGSIIRIVLVFSWFCETNKRIEIFVHAESVMLGYFSGL